MDYSAQSTKSATDMQPLDEVYWRDEILQVMYWYRGEGFGENISVTDLQIFLPADTSVLSTQMDRMVIDGYLTCDRESLPHRYAFTPYGASEGGRRFADEFSGLTGQAHGECGPDCPHCKGVSRDNCVHCSTTTA